MSWKHKKGRPHLLVLLLLVVAGIALTPLVGAANPRTITIAQSVDAESGDPAHHTAVASMNIGYQMFEALVQRDDNMELIPYLAVSWEPVDEVTWEFKLRDDVLFHDGTKMTADDVVFSFNRMLDPNSTFRVSAYIDMVERAEKVDDYTVRIITKEPNATVLGQLTRVGIVPKHYVEQVGDEEFNRRPIGTGPFKFVEWIRDQRFVMERFDDYWQGPAIAERLVFLTIPEASARLAALKTGQADIITTVPPDLMPLIESDPNLRLEPVRSIRTMFVGINAFTPPLDNVKVRQALNYAVDKHGLIEHLLEGKAYYTGKMFGPAIYGFDETDPGWPYDPEKAKQLLAEAGYPNGFTIDFDAPRGRYPMGDEVVQVIAAQLEEVGIRVNLTLSEWGTYWPKTVSGQQPALWFLSLGNPSLDADYYLHLYLSSLGRGYFHTPEFDERIFAQRRILDPEVRLPILKQLVKDVEQAAPWIFLWDLMDVYAVRAEIENWKPRPDERPMLLHTRKTSW